MTVIQLVKKLPASLKPKGSLPCSQKPATGRYPGPVETNPHPQAPMLYNNNKFGLGPLTCSDSKFNF
jgi:hypothetical protein